MKQLAFIEIISYEWHCPPAQCLELKDLSFCFVYKQNKQLIAAPNEQDYNIKHGEATRNTCRKLGTKRSKDLSFCLFYKHTQTINRSAQGPGGVELVQLNLARVWQNINKHHPASTHEDGLGGRRRHFTGLNGCVAAPDTQQYIKTANTKQDSKQKHQRFNQLTQSLADKEFSMPDESILGTSQGVLRIESPAKLVATAAGGEVATSAKDGDDEAPAAKAARKADGDTAGSKKSTTHKKR